MPEIKLPKIKISDALNIRKAFIGTPDMDSQRQELASKINSKPGGLLGAKMIAQKGKRL